MTTYLERTREIIAAALDLEIGEVTADKSIIFDLGADSLDAIEILFEMEEEFGEINDEDAENVVTVQDAANLAEKAARSRPEEDNG